MVDAGLVSIVVPCYNEKMRLPDALRAIEAHLSQAAYPAEVIVVDDCSTDGTAEAAEAFFAGRPGRRVIRHARNLGKGAAVRSGMLAAKGRQRLFTDADLSTPITELDRLLALMTAGGWDVVIGSRRKPGARLPVRQPWHRELAGRIFSILVRVVTVGGFLDTQCGFKLFTARACEAVFPRMTVERFGFDVEILYIAVRVAGLKVYEAPVTWRDHPATTVRLSRDARAMFTDLFRIRRNGRSGVYGEKIPPKH